MVQIDVPLPNRCYECPFASADFYNGIVSLSCITPTGKSMYAPDLIDRQDRPDWCPLKEQEAVPVYEDKINKCECGETIYHYWHPKFCGFCGRKLLWY